MISPKIDQKNIDRAKDLIDGAERVTIVCHTGPDGDAIGSSLAAAHVLTAIGKDAKVVVPDSFMANLHDLPGAKEIVDAAKYFDFAAKLLTETDLVLCLDFNEPRRTGRLAEVLTASTAPKILIDHHLDPDIEADVVISHPEMPATAYLLFRFLCRLELFNFIDKAAAECILAGMMTDTGNFAYNCNDPELYIVVAELVRKGADKEKLNNMLFNTFSAHCMRLNAFANSAEPRRAKPLPLHPWRHRGPRQQAPGHPRGRVQRVHAPGKRLHPRVDAQPWRLPGQHTL